MGSKDSSPCSQKSPPILCQMNPVHTLKIYLRSVLHTSFTMPLTNFNTNLTFVRNMLTLIILTILNSIWGMFNSWFNSHKTCNHMQTVNRLTSDISECDSILSITWCVPSSELPPIVAAAAPLLPAWCCGLRPRLLATTWWLGIAVAPQVKKWQVPHMYWIQRTL